MNPVLEGAFRVLIGGNDVTSRWQPTLLTLTVSKSAGKSSDSFEASLADPDGSTVMPRAGDDVTIELGHVQTGTGQVFEGFVTKVSSRGGKGQGRTISVSGSSAEHKSKIKSPALRSKADATFSSVATEWGQKVGLEVQVVGSLGSVHRDYWLQQHESFMAWGARMQRELGATFKVIGKRAFFAPRNEGLSVSGRPLTGITGAWAENLLEWDIEPIAHRPRFSVVKGRHYDLLQAKWIEKAREVPDMQVDVDFRPMIPMGPEENADQHADSIGKETEREKGGGSASIIGDYAAEPEATFTIVGARPGIDGAYKIDGVSHSLSKGDGFVTSLTLKHPQDGAGRDDR